MSPVEITSSVIAAVSLIASIVVPWVLRIRARREAGDQTELASWTSLTQALQRERDAALARLSTIDTEHRAKMAALAQDYATQMADTTEQLRTARARISALENEVDDLYARLGRRAP